jgi:AAA+ superfamily predicted ATPase
MEWGSQVKAQGYKAFSWNCQAGIREVGNGFAKDMPDPLDAVAFLTTINQKSILFLENLHRFLKGDAAIDIIQRIYNLVDQYKASLKSLVVLAPSVEIPIELSKVFTALNFDLPGREDLKKMLMYMAESTQKPLPNEAKQEALLEAGKGLAAFEFENALALSLVTKKEFDPLIIMEQKSQLIKKNASLMLEKFDENLENLGGLDNLKSFCLKVVNSPYSRGVLLLGIPGGGKSHFAKGLGKALGLPTPGLDFGRMFGSLVGESEGRIREALAVVDAFSPCILFIDEIEKGLSGIQSSGSTDGGTGSRVFGTFLTWLNDHKSRVFVVATCNDVTKMPPEFLRAERWDAIFFVDLPTERERRIILDLYQKQYHVEGEPSHGLQGWSGAEIKSLCRIAAMLKTDLKSAERFVIPLSQSMTDKIENLRDWARTRTIPATLEAREAKPMGRRVE